MNFFCDTLRAAWDEIQAAETLPAVVLAVQQALMRNRLQDSDAGNRLVKALLTSNSREEALIHVRAFMC